MQIYEQLHEHDYEDVYRQIVLHSDMELRYRIKNHVRWEIAKRHSQFRLFLWDVISEDFNGN